MKISIKGSHLLTYQSGHILYVIYSGKIYAYGYSEEDNRRFFRGCDKCDVFDMFSACLIDGIKVYSCNKFRIHTSNTWHFKLHNIYSINLFLASIFRKYTDEGIQNKR